MTRRALRWLLPLAAVALVLSVGIAHLASSNPDGLEQVAEQQGFAKQGKVTAAAPMPDYEVSALRGLLGKPMAKTTAGLAGVLLTFGLVLGIGKLVTRRRKVKPKGAPEDPDPKEASPGPDA